MQTVFHPASERGTNDIGWLKANFSFSFGPYYNPEKIRFGALRVLNDDVIAPGRGFGSHPHDNMEIITIVLEGALEHKDSMGNSGIIKAGEVQVMSAGTGIMHSEFNPSDTEATSSLQIWVYPKLRDVAPRYDQKSFSNIMRKNQFTILISPEKSENSLFAHQDAFFSMGSFDAGQQINYNMHEHGHGVYVFVLEGAVKIDKQMLNKRDALGVFDSSSFSIITEAPSRILMIAVPMV